MAPPVRPLPEVIALPLVGTGERQRRRRERRRLGRQQMLVMLLMLVALIVTVAVLAQQWLATGAGSISGNQGLQGVRTGILSVVTNQ
ncbi:MAG: hypothetical protein QOF30_2590 [Acidimicrobiaceae bacterium]|jgi:hypothetical protein|nr:hypothetical protein [Acidimicrobiaceae bacterium]